MLTDVYSERFFLESLIFVLSFYTFLIFEYITYCTIIQKKGCFESNRSILNSPRSKATSKKSDPSSPKLCSLLNPKHKRKQITLHPLLDLGNNPTPNPKASKKFWPILSGATPWWNTQEIPANHTVKWSISQMITNIYVGNRSIKKMKKVSQLPPSSKSGKDVASPTTRKTGSAATCPRP